MNVYLSKQPVFDAQGNTYCYELDAEKTVETVNRLINPFDRDLTLEEMNLVKADRYMS